MNLRPIWRGLVALALVLAPTLAFAQGIPAFQSGTVTPNHLVKNAGNGQHMDVGGLTGDANGRGVSPFAITDNLGLGLCTHSAATGGQHYEFCLGHDSSGNALLSLTANGGALERSLFVSKNGTLYEWPGTGSGNVVGPSPTTAGMIPAFNNGSGTLLSQPGTARLGADGLNIGIGVAPVANESGNAVQIVQTGSASNFSTSNALFLRNAWSGADVNANIAGTYSTLWYQGTAGNQGVAIKGNAYTYTNASAVQGTAPNEYFNAPNIGTLTYFAGVYGRPAHYLPGTITYAASIMADGLFNISTPSGGTVTNFANLLAIPPYVQATNNYAMLVPSAACSPTCYNATIASIGDPIRLSTGGNLDIVLAPGGTGQVSSSAPIIADSDQTCSAQIQGSATAGSILANGSNCSLQVSSQGSGSVIINKLPTGCGGLTAGTLYNNAGTPAICP